MPAVLLGVPPSSVQRSDRLTRTALGVALGSALLGVGLGALHRVGGYRVETDFYVYYLPQAREITDGPPLLRGLVHNPPGFALLIGLGGKLLRDEFAAAKLLGALAAGAFVWVAFRLTQRSFGSSVALTVALFLAIAVAPYSYLAATDVLGAFAMTAPVWWLVSRLRVGARECFVTGVMVGVAYLLRSNTIAMLPVLALAIPYGFLRHQPRRLRWRAAGVLVAGCALAVAPWLALNAHYNGSALASTAYLQIAAHFFGEGGDANGIISLQAAATRFASLGQVLRHDPPELVSRYARDVLFHNPSSLLARTAPFPAILLVGAGLYRLSGRLSLASIVWLAVCVAEALLLGLVGFNVRYYLFAFPWVFVLLALGAEPAWATLRSDGSAALVGRWSARLMLAVSLVVLLVFNVGLVRSQLRAEPRWLPSLANAMRGLAQPGDLMVSRKPHLASLSGLRWKFPIAQDAAELLEAARRDGARFLVYSDAEAAIWPPLSVFADPAMAPPGLQPRLRDAPSGTIVYELVPPGSPASGDT